MRFATEQLPAALYQSLSLQRRGPSLFLLSIGFNKLENSKKSLAQKLVL